MLEYSDERRPWESMEEKLTLIRFVIHFSCIHFIFSIQQLGEFHLYCQEKNANDFLNFVRFGLKFEKRNLRENLKPSAILCLHCPSKYFA